MRTDEMTAPPTDELETQIDGADSGPDALQWEANRLMEFKKEKVKRNNQTPCPACATYVHINANKCPHCSSDIAANNALIRESLRRLTEITEQLEAIHDQHMERLHGAPRRPLGERLKSFFADRQTREDMKLVVPSLFLFFVVVATLRVISTPTIFGAFAIAGGAALYLIFNRMSVKRLVTIDLYRTVLVFGVLVMVASSVAQPDALWPWANGTRVEVLGSTVNIRASSTTQSDVVATARRGEKLSVIERRNDWYQVETADGSTGWIHASLVRD